MAVTSIVSNSKYIKPLWSGLKTFAHDAANMVVGVDQNSVFTEELEKLVRGTKGSDGKYVGGDGFNNFRKNVKTAWEKSKKAVKDKSLWTVIKDSFKSMGDEFKNLKNLPKLLGKGGKLAETGKILWKRMPLIGNILTVAFEVPNIIKAFTDTKDGGGIGTGLVETGKAALKMGGFVAGMTLGGIFGPLGGIAGGFIGSWIADKLLGKSFSETVEEKQAKGAAGVSTGNVPVTASNQTAPGGSANNPFAYSNLGFTPKSYTANDYRTKDIMSLGLGIAQ